MSDLVGTHIVGFPTRRLISMIIQNFKPHRLTIPSVAIQANSRTMWSETTKARFSKHGCMSSRSDSFLDL